MCFRSPGKDESKSVWLISLIYSKSGGHFEWFSDTVHFECNNSSCNVNPSITTAFVTPNGQAVHHRLCLECAALNKARIMQDDCTEKSSTRQRVKGRENLRFAGTVKRVQRPLGCKLQPLFIGDKQGIIEQHTSGVARQTIAAKLGPSMPNNLVGAFRILRKQFSLHMSGEIHRTGATFATKRNSLHWYKCNVIHYSIQFNWKHQIYATVRNSL